MRGMTDVILKDPGRFAEELLKAYLHQGFQSLSKRDIDLLVYFLLERDGAIDRSATNFDVARSLRVTPSKVKSIRRDAYARWRPLVEDDRKTQLMKILSSVLTEEHISAGAQHASAKSQKDGFLAIRVEHPDDKEELEQAIMEVGGIPVYERNRDVLAIRFDTLLSLADRLGFASNDPKKIRTALKKIAPGAESVQELLKTEVTDLTWEQVRTAFNAAGAEILTGAINTKATALLRIAFPFLA